MHIAHLIWDDFNIAHIAEHEVKPHEVEEACQSNQITFTTYGARILLVGHTLAGRFLSVVLAYKGEGVYYVITARPASRKERKYYQEQKGGEQAA